MARSAPDLTEALKEELKNLSKKVKKQLPRYEYPKEIITATVLESYSRYGVDFEIPRGKAELVRRLDAQREAGKEIFGAGYLISDDLAWERLEMDELARENREKKIKYEKPAILWELSEREKEVCRRLANGAV